MYRSILSLSKIANQIWRDHRFSQKKRTTENSEGGGWRWKGNGGGWTRGGLHKVGGLAPLCQLCKETLKITHPPIIKPIPHSWLSPVSSENFPSPHYSHFWKTHSPIYKWRGVRTMTKDLLKKLLHSDLSGILFCF